MFKKLVSVVDSNLSFKSEDMIKCASPQALTIYTRNLGAWGYCGE